MKERLLTYLYYNNEYYGVELISKGGQAYFYGLGLKQQKKEVNIIKTFEADAINLLQDHIPKQRAINLVVNTDAVLTKTIETPKVINDNLQLVHSAFPNIDSNAFYYEILRQDMHCFISICRKDYLEDLITSLQSLKLNIINITLGHSVVSTLNQSISQNELLSNNSLLTFNNGQLLTVKTIELSKFETYTINGLELNNTHLLSASAALQILLKNSFLDSNINDKTRALTDDFIQDRIFSQALKVGMVSVLTILLINFFLFNHYYSGVNTLRETSQLITTSKAQILQLNAKVTKTEKMIHDVLKSGASKSSFFASDLIHDMPETILLSALNYHPLLKRIKADKPILADTNIIILSGASSDRQLFSTWISSLEAKSWVTHVEIISYEDTSKTKALFSLKLTMHHEKEN